MILTLAKWIVIYFGGFFICAVLIMLINPLKAREILRKVGSKSFINYAEITLRMIPAIALILAVDRSKYPEVFKVFGCFMLCPSFIPRQIHHNFSTKATDYLKPFYLQLILSFAFVIGKPNGFICSACVALANFLIFTVLLSVCSAPITNRRERSPLSHLSIKPYQRICPVAMQNTYFIL